jgi:hypothetical protein
MDKDHNDKADHSDEEGCAFMGKFDSCDYLTEFACDRGRKCIPFEYV